MLRFAFFISSLLQLCVQKLFFLLLLFYFMFFTLFFVYSYHKRSFYNTRHTYIHTGTRKQTKKRCIFAYYRFPQQTTNYHSIYGLNSFCCCCCVCVYKAAPHHDGNMSVYNKKCNVERGYQEKKSRENEKAIAYKTILYCYVSQTHTGTHTRKHIKEA